MVYHIIRLAEAGGEPVSDAVDAVGEAVVGAAADAAAGAADAAAGVVSDIAPPGLLDTLHTFFQTQLGGFAWRCITIAVIIMFAMVSARIVDRALRRAVATLRESKNPNASVLAFARYVALLGIYFLAFSGVVAAIPALSSILNTLLATGGVLAIVLGFAAQNALGSIASGMMILFFKPFIIGDVLNVVSIGVTGTVEDITLRHTVLKTVENKRVIVPNSTMNDAVVENFDYAEKQVCLMLDIGITYESDLEKALSILAEEVAAHPDYLDPRTPAQKAQGEPAVTVRVQELADSAVILRALLWGADNGAAFGMKCDLLRSLKNRFDREGLEFAYPHVHVVGSAPPEPAPAPPAKRRGKM
ncbi:MAG: mechanosensitive ion channel family protein [Clostridiaceae bacterium]|nr:mechanosensitive ion channel family protein [Clostridiaceae bacterium]